VELDVAGRQAQCPNCGGPIAWKLGASAALVCPWCRFTVVRTDRDLRAIGRVADLVPTAPIMTVGDRGRLAGRGFVVLGRMQLDHGAGPWDEWYVAMEDGAWAWLAKAQGRVHLTFVAPATVPHESLVRPGATIPLPGGGANVPWTVTERGTSRVVSAEGELPFAVTPGEYAHYADLVAPGDGFATIDWGAGDRAASVYVGRSYAQSDLTVEPAAMAARPAESVGVRALKCPNCGGPCPVFVPDRAERVACPNCYASLDFERGAFKYLGQLNQPRVVPLVPLGREGTLRGERVMCIGMMERGVVVEGILYSWREYLIHSDKGYRWLMEENGHFTYVMPVSAADVAVSGRTAKHAGRSHKLFARGYPQVRFVIGEFYWKVQVGETTAASDYIAPPYLVSEERSEDEINWSAGEYVPGDDIWKAFGLPGRPPRPYDVSPSQPNPVKLGLPAAVTVIGIAIAFAIYGVSTMGRPSDKVLLTSTVPMPAAPEADVIRYAAATSPTAPAPALATSGPSMAPSITSPFTLEQGYRAVEVSLRSDLNQGWLGVRSWLVNETNGECTEFAITEDRFHELGPPSRTNGAITRVDIGDLDPGQYVLRIDPRWARKPGAIGELTPPAATLQVATYTPDSSGCCCIAVGFLVLPLPFAFIRRRLFESRRWRNSSVT
jgi:ribosomal protein S27AE